MSTNGRAAVKIAAMIGGGAVLGAALGILMAPKAGKETRRDVARYAKRAQVQATRLSRSMKHGVSNVVARGKALAKKEEHPQAA